MQRKLIVAIAALLTVTNWAAKAQGDNEKNYGITFSGFVRNDMMWDSRQGLAVREGVFLLWPEKQSYDIYGNDINATPNFNMLAVLTRLRGDISGPDAFGAKTSGVIELDFFGTADPYTGLVRMRHGFLKLVWNEKTELLIGQTWNPLFVTANYPTTVSISSGTPFNSFARNPQVRLTTSAGKVTFLAAALSQRDFPSVASANGITSSASSSYLRNSSIPDLHFQTHYNTKNSSGTSFLAGAGIAWKSIVPSLRVHGIPQTIKSDARVNGLSAILFARATMPSLSLKLYARYGENLNDIVNPGGYGISDFNASTNQFSYIPLRNVSYWTDIHTNGNRLQAGIFAGYLCNRGSSADLAGTQPAVFGRAMDMARLMRVSPRVSFFSGKTIIGTEVEYTRAWYGDGTHDLRGIPQNIEPVANIRIVTNFTYNF